MLPAQRTLLKLKLDAAQPSIVQVDEPVDHDEMCALRHLVLLIGILQVAVKHLDDRILAVHLALMVL